MDDLHLYKQVDSADMLNRIHELPWQCQEAWRMAAEFHLPGDLSRIDSVVILGMGGSAIGGDLVSSLALAESKAPIFICRDYNLPAFVNSRTLVIANSYSGETEETLAAFRQALSTEASKLALTTGGSLKKLAEERGVPVFSYSYPAQPRAALGFSFIPILCFLQRLGLLRDKSADVAEAVSVMQDLSRRIGENVSTKDNPAKQLAQKFFGKLAVIYGAGILSEVAHRWKTQLNENSKALAFYEVFPELNHNAVVGYQFPAEVTARTMVVLLKSAQLHERLLLRYEITCQLLKQAGIAYQIIEGEGKSPLGQMLGLVLFGDYVSYYLAILNKIDPAVIKAINYLKGQLKNTKL